MQPLLDELATIDDAADPDALAVVVGVLQRSGVGGGVAVYVDTDAKNSSRYLVHVAQSGLGLPDESYYRDEQHAELLAAYPGHIARMFALVYGGEPEDHSQTAARIVALETKLAAAHWDVVKRRDADLTYNLRTFADLQADAAGFNWSGWVSALGSTPEAVAELVVQQPDYLTTLGELWRSEDFDDWKSWARWRLIHARAGLLTDALVAEDFAFYGSKLTGAEQIRERWKRGVGLVEGLLGDAVGKLYVQRHFPPDAKARIDALVANLREAYRVSINNLDWMTPQTRQRALTKLDKFTAKVAYPDKWRDYSTLVIDRDDLYGNYRRGCAVEYDRELAKLGGPVDRDEWFMTPQTVNAYYNPGMNEIVFPAAILQPPFFDPDVDDAVNYGGIGAVIGHEIGHGFDDQGAKYDGDGNLVDWWTDDDRTEFGARTKALIEQYEVYTPPRARWRPSRQRCVHRWREHRRSGRSFHRAAGLPAVAGRRGPRPSSTASPACSGCSSAGPRCGAPSHATPRRSGGWPSTRTRRRSSAATASSATSTPSTRPSTSRRTTSYTWTRNAESGSGTKPARAITSASRSSRRSCV